MRGTLILVAAIVVVPLLLLALRSGFAWRYRRMLRTEMARVVGTEGHATSPPPTPAATDRPQLKISRLHAPAIRPVSSEARILDDDARAMTRRVRRVFAAATLVYSAVVSTTLGAALLPSVPADARAVAVYLSQASVLFVSASVLSLRPWTHAAVIGAYIAAGSAGLLAAVPPARAAILIAAEAQLFLFLPAIGLALLVVRRLRPLLVALTAVLIYVSISVAGGIILSEAAPLPASPVRPLMWGLSVFSFVAGLVILGWLLGRRSVRRPVIGLAVLGALGLVIEFVWDRVSPVGAVMFAVPLDVLVFFLVWLVLRLIVRLQDLRVLSVQVLQSHIAFGFLSFYWVLVTQVSSALFVPQTWPAISIAAAFGSYTLVLHVLLHHVVKPRTAWAGKRLLFLRAFGSTRHAERLLHALHDTWRRIGPIDLIAGTDVGEHTLSSRTVEAFLVRRIDTQFLASPQDVTTRLQRLRSELEGDGRYPVNDIHCHADTWPFAVRALAPLADAVLMDLRGFSRRNQGCVFELTELIHRVPLRRTVVLADRTTDMSAVAEVAQTAWAGVPDTAPGASEHDPELRVLDYDRPRALHERALCALLFGAAAAKPGTAHQR